MTDEQETVDSPKKGRGWPRGKPRKPPVEAQTPSASPVEAPIHVRLRLKDYGEDIEFGCARRLTENGFHVFFYPSKRDPYRETRREFAIDQIIEIEITEARQVYDYRQIPPVMPQNTFTSIDPVPADKPVIHSAKKWALERQAEKLREEGNARISAVPGITFGDSVG